MNMFYASGFGHSPVYSTVTVRTIAQTLFLGPEQLLHSLEEKDSRTRRQLGVT